MVISKNALKLLKYANTHESVNFEETCFILKQNIHSAYEWELISTLEKYGLVISRSEMMPEGYKSSTFRITPQGTAYLEKNKSAIFDKVFTRTLAIAAFVISIIALVKQ